MYVTGTSQAADGPQDYLTIAYQAVPPDTTPPTVGAVSPSTAPVGLATTFSAAYSDNIGVVSCNFFADGIDQGVMTLSAPGGTGGTATRSHTFTTLTTASITHTVQAQCSDTTGNLGIGPLTTVTVAFLDTDADGISDNVDAAATTPSTAFSDQAIGGTTFGTVRVGILTLNPGEYYLRSVVIDTANGFGYFGTEGGIVLKVKLADLILSGGAVTFKVWEQPNPPGVRIEVTGPAVAILGWQIHAP